MCSAGKHNDKQQSGVLQHQQTFLCSSRAARLELADLLRRVYGSSQRHCSFPACSSHSNTVSRDNCTSSPDSSPAHPTEEVAHLAGKHVLSLANVIASFESTHNRSVNGQQGGVGSAADGATRGPIYGLRPLSSIVVDGESHVLIFVLPEHARMAQALVVDRWENHCVSQTCQLFIRYTIIPIPTDFESVSSTTLSSSCKQNSSSSSNDARMRRKCLAHMTHKLFAKPPLRSVLRAAEGKGSAAGHGKGPRFYVGGA